MKVFGWVHIQCRSNCLARELWGVPKFCLARTPVVKPFAHQHYPLIIFDSSEGLGGGEEEGEHVFVVCLYVCLLISVTTLAFSKREWRKEKFTNLRSSQCLSIVNVILEKINKKTINSHVLHFRFEWSSTGRSTHLIEEVGVLLYDSDLFPPEVHHDRHHGRVVLVGRGTGSGIKREPGLVWQMRGGVTEANLAGWI